MNGDRPIMHGVEIDVGTISAQERAFQTNAVGGNARTSINKAGITLSSVVLVGFIQTNLEASTTWSSLDATSDDSIALDTEAIVGVDTEEGDSVVKPRYSKFQRLRYKLCGRLNTPWKQAIAALLGILLSIGFILLIVLQVLQFCYRFLGGIQSVYDGATKLRKVSFLIFTGLQARGQQEPIT